MTRRMIGELYTARVPSPTTPIGPYERRAAGVRPWDPRLAEVADRVIAIIHSVRPDLAIEHIGSTAVPGLGAKPIIDMVAGVSSLARADALVELLCRCEYTTSAEFNATLPDSRWLMRWADGHRTHHLHLAIHGGPFWEKRLRFRDALRASPALAARYFRLKTDLASKYRTDREAYTDAKNEFVRSVAG